ncbi:Cysteine sulfinate desulfinase/cysteine desulfurase [Melia azedarach]|uniref:Cysteine sulfinate desulfinase/cysteine desulfurase n=2 Tax=Melia azedarach TaxID=155640 RepID=A0ACC1YDN0_MELAZ|nr:Cysteine sulfinate desulfinase/cysteine desulfurase [Melia azedarach]
MSAAVLPMRLLLPLSTTTNTSFYSSDFPSKSLKSTNPNFNLFSYSSSSSSTSSSVGYVGYHQHSCPSRRSDKTWLCGHMRRDQDMDGWKCEEEDNVVGMFGSDEDTGTQIPTQAQSIVEGSGAVMVSEYKPVPDVDYLQELLAIQQQGPRAIGFFGTRNMGFMHQELIEILSYALVITKNHIYTSGASGTNAAVIRGALRAEKPELLTVILPQSLKKQPPESQELLAKVKTVIEKPHNDHLPLIEASRLCNMDIISHVQQVICFAFHDSKLLMETCQEAKNLRKIVTLFYLD